VGNVRSTFGVQHPIQSRTRSLSPFSGTGFQPVPHRPEACATNCKGKQDAASAQVENLCHHSCPRSEPGLTNPGFFYRFLYFYKRLSFAGLLSSFHKRGGYEEAHDRVDLWVLIGAALRLGAEMD
jgi:hypothetical protein